MKIYFALFQNVVKFSQLVTLLQRKKTYIMSLMKVRTMMEHVPIIVLIQQQQQNPVPPLKPF